MGTWVSFCLGIALLLSPSTAIWCCLFKVGLSCNLWILSHSQLAFHPYYVKEIVENNCLYKYHREKMVIFKEIRSFEQKGSTRSHFLFQSWCPFPAENSTGVQCLRTSGKFGCAWACKEVFLRSVFSRISKQTLERTVSVAVQRIWKSSDFNYCSFASLVLQLICKNERSQINRS